MKSLPTFQQVYQSADKDLKEIVNKLEDTPQSPKWHPEGDTLVHTKIVFNRAKAHGDADLLLAAFFHDLGKAETTEKNKRGEWAAHGHEFASLRIAKQYREFIESFGCDFDKVKTIIKEHMRIKQFPKMRESKKEKLRENPYFEDLNKFTEFDSMINVNLKEIKDAS